MAKLAIYKLSLEIKFSVFKQLNSVFFFKYYIVEDEYFCFPIICVSVYFLGPSILGSRYFVSCISIMQYEYVDTQHYSPLFEVLNGSPGTFGHDSSVLRTII